MKGERKFRVKKEKERKNGGSGKSTPNSGRSTPRSRGALEVVSVDVGEEYEPFDGKLVMISNDGAKKS